MSITPVSAAAQGVRAQLQIVRPRDPTPIPLCFNPTEYQISKANTFAEIPIPGLETPLIQYVRGDSEKLSVEALVDTSDTLDDVRVRYVQKLRGLMSINALEHAQNRPQPACNSDCRHYGTADPGDCCSDYLR